ncbi:MAG: DUF5989 family protein [Candidatus Levybacteria bacterium]|nr:DUF5989 family protein [Candidatus Levybacteria bacterium]
MLRSFFLKLLIVIELFGFLWDHKLWWIIPVIFVMLIITFILIFGQSTGIAPFIYPFF